MKSILIAISLAGLLSSAAQAQVLYPVPKYGHERIRRTGTCPTGYVGKGVFCENLRRDTNNPRVYQVIPGTTCPTGTFRSGDYCKAFR